MIPSIVQCSSRSKGFGSCLAPGEPILAHTLTSIPATSSLGGQGSIVKARELKGGS